MSHEVFEEEFEAIFPDEDACLTIIFEKRYGRWNICPICYKRSKFHRVAKRKCFACQRCGFQVYPLANTIYHKSSTPLRTWFYAMYLFSRDNDISAKELQRQSGVTYKTAWRMLAHIKKLSTQPPRDISKLVEINEQFISDFVLKLKTDKRFE
jgi:transposase